MKQINNIILVMGLILGALFITSCEKSAVDDDLIPRIQLTEVETNALLYMYEEEKLARDVYRFSYEKYGLPIFNNISNSEQNHLEAVTYEMNRFGVDNPFDEVEGSFQNPDLMMLYKELIDQSSESLPSALVVGATIEDLDIKDLLEAKSQTDNSFLTQMYDNLQCGSENHLRSFMSQLQVASTSYEPQFISSELFETVLSSPHTSCGFGGR